MSAGIDLHIIVCKLIKIMASLLLHTIILRSLRLFYLPIASCARNSTERLQYYSQQQRIRAAER
jgi:hypothetical protein